MTVRTAIQLPRTIELLLHLVLYTNNTEPESLTWFASTYRTRHQTLFPRNQNQSRANTPGQSRRPKTSRQEKMSNIYSSRKGPLLIAAGVLGGLLYFGAGGRAQPRPATKEGQPSQLSETLHGLAQQGGPSARVQSGMELDPKDTRMASTNPVADSKRNPQKVRGDLGGDGTDEGGAGLGKHIGNKGEGSTDLPWKKVGKD